MEYTYLARDDNFYKIGKSINPVKRIDGLKTANPNIRLIAYGTSISEFRLHQLFAKYKIKREWFKLSNSQVVYIIKLLKNDFSGKLRKDKKFDKYSEFTINFGKYKYTKITDMTSLKELNYLIWVCNNTQYKRAIKVFKWWLRQFDMKP